MITVVVQQDAIEYLENQPFNSIDLIYVDPPFGTGEKQELKTIKSERTGGDGHIGFGGNKYSHRIINSMSYPDIWPDYLAFVDTWLSLAKNVLKDTGLIYIHLDYRFVHYVKVMCDNTFGYDNFVNEIIWAWDYGGKPKNKWPNKHNTILVYSKTQDYFFDQSQVDRLSYMAPGLVTKEKAELGKIPTDVWWFSIVGTNSKERTGYPNQKPEKLLTRIISTSCPPDGLVLDFFAGSGTTGAVCKKLDRNCILVDNNPDAITIINERIK